MKQSKLIKSTVLNKMIAILLVFCLIIANYALTGVSIVEAANEILEETTTKNSNIEFDAFFKGKGIITTRQKSLKIGETANLCLEIKVNDEVALVDGVISFENPNFIIKNDELSENKYITNVDTEANQIKLAKISSYDEVSLELPIEFKKQDKIPTDYLEKETIITLKGKYENINQKQKDYKGVTSIKPRWSAESDVNLSQSVEKFFGLGENGTLLQQKVTTEVIENTLPRNKEMVEITVPTILDQKPNWAIVLIDGRKATNEEMQYDGQTGVIKVENQNKQDEEGNISWQNKSTEYTIIYNYPSNLAVAQIPVTLNAKSHTYLYSNEEEISKEISEEAVLEPVGSLATVKTTLYGDLYKGYLYHNEDKKSEYKEKNDIEISYKEGIEKLELKSNDIQNITYKQTQFSKEELSRILGENFVVTIKNQAGETISQVTKDTETDENGIITVNYNEGEAGVIIETSKPELEGIFTVLTTKELNGKTDQNLQVLKSFRYLSTHTELSTNLSKETADATIELKEPTTEAKLDINKTTLITEQDNKDIEIKVTLLSNDAKYDVYSNPELTIEFPQEIEEVAISQINRLYAEEYTEIKPVQYTVDGKQVIKIQLIGTQKEHKKPGIEGTVINLKANIKVNKETTSRLDSIKLTYTNGSATSYNTNEGLGRQEKQIEILSSKDLIITNSIPQLGVKTYGEENQAIANLDIGASEKVLTVENEIINNKSTPVQNIKLLGMFGTAGNIQIGDMTYENNINSVLQTAISVENIDTSKVKIYYSENEKATEDTEDPENNWQENITNPSAVKKYLVEVTELDVKGDMKLSYNIAIPANLNYDQQMNQNYIINYSDTSERVEKATAIALKTKVGAKVEASLSAKVGGDNVQNNAEVKRGEQIQYNVNVKNIGDENLTDLIVDAKIPEYTTLESKNEQNQIKIPSLAIGEETTVNYVVKVNKDAQTNQKITSSANINYAQQSITTNVLDSVVANASGDISVSVTDSLDSEDIVYTKNRDGQFEALITNNTDRDLTNVKIEWNVPDVAEFRKQFIEENGTKQQETDKNIMVIPKISSRGEVLVRAIMDFKDLTEDKNFSVYANITYNDETYHSNSIDRLLAKISNPEFTISSNIPNGSNVKHNDVIEYYIKVKNNDSFQRNGETVECNLPAFLKLKKATVTNEDGEVENLELNGNMFEYHISYMRPNSKDKESVITITLKTVVDYAIMPSEDIYITTKAELMDFIDQKETETEEITHIIKAGTQPPEVNPSPSPSAQPSTSPSPENPNEPVEVKNSISGYVWVDTNANGQMDSDETRLPHHIVWLWDVNNNDLLRDSNGTPIRATTNTSEFEEQNLRGLYTFENIPSGKYLAIFEYENYTYKPTDYMKQGVPTELSSRAISNKMTIDSGEKEYGVTDVIEIGENTKITNINFGLIKQGKFDLKVDKYISKIIVNNKDGVKQYEFSNPKELAKVEINSRKMNGSYIIFEYNMVITNVGDTAGYATLIEDDMPSDLEFSSEMNRNWYQVGSKLQTTALEGEVIAPGSSKTLTLTLTKTMTNSNTGIVTNNAQIISSHSVFGDKEQEQELNGGTNQGESNSSNGSGGGQQNNYSSSDAIISVSTGDTKIFAGLIFILLTIMSINIVLLKKECSIRTIMPHKKMKRKGGKNNW